jgi:hypothetical protein
MNQSAPRWPSLSHIRVFRSWLIGGRRNRGPRRSHSPRPRRGVPPMGDRLDVVEEFHADVRPARRVPRRTHNRSQGNLWVIGTGVASGPVLFHVTPSFMGARLAARVSQQFISRDRSPAGIGPLCTVVGDSGPPHGRPILALHGFPQHHFEFRDLLSGQPRGLACTRAHETRRKRQRPVRTAAGSQDPQRGLGWR